MKTLELKAIKLDLLNACNERCHFCPYYGANGTVINGEGKRIEAFSKLEIETLEQMFSDLKRAKLSPQIKISGWGEGMLHPQFDQIVTHAHNYGFDVRIITNGTKILEHQKTIEDSISVLIVSIHGNDQIHDKIVGRNGAYTSAIKGILALQKQENKKTRRTLQKIILAYVITPENIRYMLGHVQLCDQLGVEPRFQHDFTPNKPSGMIALPMEPMDLEGLQKMIDTVLKIRPTTQFIPPLDSTSLSLFYSNAHFVLNPYRCDRVPQEVEIRSNGEVYSCRSGVFGNINTASIVDIIQDKGRENFLRKVTDETMSAKGLNDEKCDRCCYQSGYVMMR